MHIITLILTNHFWKTSVCVCVCVFVCLYCLCWGDIANLFQSIAKAKFHPDSYRFFLIFIYKILFVSKRSCAQKSAVFVVSKRSLFAAECCRKREGRILKIFKRKYIFLSTTYIIVYPWMNYTEWKKSFQIQCVIIPAKNYDSNALNISGKVHWWKRNFPMNPHARLLVGCLFGRSVCHNFLKGREVHFHDPIGVFVSVI